MSYAKQMLDSYLRDFNVDAGVLAAPDAMRYRRPGMSAIRGQCTGRAFPALTIVLALGWLASVAAPASADGPAAHVAATLANGRAAIVHQHLVFGGLVANRRDKPGRHSAILLGIQTVVLETALLVAAGSGWSAAVRPGRRTQPALVDARAPP